MMIDIESFVSREVYEKLMEYIKLLLKWNNTINLISSNTINEVVHRHIIDSLQLLKFIENKDIKIVDLGSGAGFPAIVLSIAGIRKVTLIESNSRKVSFLLQAAKLSQGDVEIVNDRIEDVVGLRCDIVTSRAFASIDKIFALSQGLEVSNKYLLHKGEKYQEEVFKAEKHWLFNIKVHDSITSDYGKILEITDVKHIP
jgi:16S rRNA (guanine527-N7)-methyltransferase